MWKRANALKDGGLKLLTPLAVALLPSLLPGQGTEEATDQEQPGVTEASKLEAAPSPELLASLAAELRARYAGPRSQWPPATVDEGVKFEELGTPPPSPSPDGNPTTPPKATLGLSLFFDPRLSGSVQISCATCHSPELGWADGRAFARGNFQKSLKRHTPSLLGVGHASHLFWDGRQTTLEDQAVEVITNPDEMDAEPGEVVSRLAKEKEFYGPLFQKAFGDDNVTFDRIVQALAAFQRSLRIGRSPFDQFLSGKHEALTDAGVRGLHLFRTKGRCLNCHHGPMLQSDTFHNLGLTYYGRKYEDLGRYQVTDNADDVGRFKTPTLRNVARTGPWMHNGLFPSLEGVLRLYNAGMPRPRPKPAQVGDPLFPKTDALLKPLGLTPQELADLKAFLEALNEPQTRVR